MGTSLMPAEENRVFALLGMLQNQMATLSENFDNFKNDTVEEQRKVHDIVVATNEAMRNIARDVSEMKPHVESYKMKAEKLDEAIQAGKEYKVEKAEERGAEKFKKWIYGLVASASAFGAIMLGKLIDWITSRPHVPVIAIIILAIAVVATAGAFVRI